MRGSARGRPKNKCHGDETKREAVRLVRAGNRPGDVARRLEVPGADLAGTWAGKAAGKGRTPARGAVRTGVGTDADGGRVAELEREPGEERARNEVLREMMCDPKAGDPGRLSNSGKAELGERLRADLGWPLRDVPARSGISKSSHGCARRANERRAGRDAGVDALVASSFARSGGAYGYRRVWADIASSAGGGPAGGPVSQREVRAPVRRQRLRGRRPRARRRWSSYAGEPDDRPENVPRERALARREAGEDLGLGHDFSAAAPGELAAADVTEFSIPAGKVYLSPVTDRFDGEPAARPVPTSPDSELAVSSLGRYLASLPGGPGPVVHTDGGATYRSASWKAACEAAGVTRSMSGRAACPDNARAEGFFGTPREEFFLGRDWSGVGVGEFEGELDGYLRWYVDDRPEAFRDGGETRYETIAGRRRRLGLAL